MLSFYKKNNKYQTKTLVQTLCIINTFAQQKLIERSSNY